MAKVYLILYILWGPPTLIASGLHIIPMPNFEMCELVAKKAIRLMTIPGKIQRPGVIKEEQIGWSCVTQEFLELYN